MHMPINFQCLVGGGTLFTSSAGTPGSLQAAAAALVPSGLGLTPIAYFPPTASQSLPALSVIFREASSSGRRKKRYARKYKFGKRRKG